VAVADTKQLACAAALTYARREALELAGVSIRAVTSIRDVMTDDDTTSRFEAKIDQVASGLVKTVEKNLESSYDEESGAIRCLVNARFEVEKSKLLDALLQGERQAATKGTSSIDIGGDWITTFRRRVRSGPPSEPH
jgi:hypothetical protein